MKKVILATVMALVSAVSIFAQSKAPTEKNKIGGYLGWPIGFSYSHKMSPLMELDIMAGADTYGWWTDDHYHYKGHDYRIISDGIVFTARVAPLFRCWEGPLWTGAYGKLSVGPAAGFHIGSTRVIDYSYNKTTDELISGFTVSAPVRFDIDFNFPLNVFVELAPAGIQMSFTSFAGLNHYFGYYARGAIGARYRF